MSAGGYHHHIGLNTWESRGGSPPSPGTTGLYHTAILYPTRAALADALTNRNREGIAHWVMRNRAYVGALRAEGDYLLLVTLRNAEEVISAKDLPKPAGRAPTQKELNMAKQLVELLEEDEFNAKDYKDEYRERVMEFIEKKARGKAPRLHAVKSKRKVSELDSVLEKSLRSLRKEKRAA